MSSLPEDALAREFQQRGERATFDQLCRLLLPRLQRHLLVLTRGDIHDAEDLQQEVLVAFFRALRTFHFQSRVTTFLWGLTHHVATSHLRSWSRRRRREDRAHRLAVPLAATEDPVGQVERAWEADDLLRVLATLKPQDRALLHLKELEGLSLEDLAGVFHIPIGTVKSRLSRARKTLATRLNEEAPHG